MSENELSNGFDTDGISKLNRETDDADEENIDISTTKSENNSRIISIYLFRKR